MSSKEKKKKHIDIAQYIGGIGLFQVAMFLIVTPAPFTSNDTVSINFLGGFMDHWCQVEQLQNFSFSQQRYIAIPCDDDVDIGYRECYKFPFDYTNIDEEEYYAWNRSQRTDGITEEDYETCGDNWVFDRSLYVETIRSRFGLVCDDNWLVEFLSTVYMFGRLIGSLLCGFVADWYGRKVSVIIFAVFRVAGSILCLYAPEYISYAVSRFLIAAGSTGYQLSLFVMVTEVFDNKFRPIFSCLWFVVGSTGYMFMSLFAFYLRDDSDLQAVLTWPTLVLILLYFALPESTLWQATKGKTKEAEENIRFIAECNNRTLPEHLDLQTETDEKETDNVQKEEDKPKESFFELFKHRNLLIRTLIIYLTWFTNSLVYYGLSLNTGRLAGSIYVNNFLFGFVEIPANLISIYVLKAWGRRLLLGGSLVLGGISSFICVIVVLADGNENIVTAFSVLGKGFITASFTAVYVYSSEIFPTSQRNTGIGSSSMVSRIAGMLAPFIGGTLMDVWEPMPSLIFGSFGLASGLLIFIFMPETLNAELPNTIKEAAAFKGSKQEKDVIEMNVAGGEDKSADSPTTVTDTEAKSNGHVTTIYVNLGGDIMGDNHGHVNQAFNEITQL